MVWFWFCKRTQSESKGTWQMQDENNKMTTQHKDKHHKENRKEKKKKITKSKITFGNTVPQAVYTALE